MHRLSSVFIRFQTAKRQGTAQPGNPGLGDRDFAYKPTPREFARDPVLLEFLGLPNTGKLLESGRTDAKNANEESEPFLP
jgi:hypothetical protein